MNASGTAIMEIGSEPIDRAFADFALRHAAPDLNETDRALLRRLAHLVSAFRGHGHSCVDLVRVADRLIRDEEGAEPWRCPSPETGLALLRRAGLVAAPSEPPRTPLVADGSRLYLRRYHAAECRLAVSIRERLLTRAATPRPVETLAPLFRQLFPAAATSADWQALASVAALQRPLVFVTGGPGTGKTTVAARLLALLLEQDPRRRIALAAPTGRAAARLGDAMTSAAAREELPDVVRTALPRSGRTLHQLLGYNPATDRFTRTADSPLAEDIVLVDEASMIDVLLMDALLAAVRPTARLILLGDPDQLASVDTGFVLGDIVQAAGGRRRAESTRHGPPLVEGYARLAGAPLPGLEANAAVAPLGDAVVCLHHSWRFATRQGIGQVAAAARVGDAATVIRALTRDGYPDARLIAHAATPDALLAPVREAMEQYLASPMPADALQRFATVRLLCAVREGDEGVRGVNARVERWLRSRSHETDGWYPLRPVLITANDEGTGLHNGDVGITFEVDGVPRVHFPAGDGTVRSFAPARLPAHETAWAMTVHKAQGSEFDQVVFVLPDEPSRLLTRELLYTAVTRARQAVTLIGSATVLEAMVEASVTRHSGLAARLEG